MLPQTCAWHRAVMNGAAGCLNGDSVPACRRRRRTAPRVTRRLACARLLGGWFSPASVDRRRPLGWVVREAQPYFTHSPPSCWLLLRIQHLQKNQLLCAFWRTWTKQAPCEIIGQKCYVIGATWVKGLLSLKVFPYWWRYAPSDNAEVWLMVFA
jgi:hypothetical protein